MTFAPGDRITLNDKAREWTRGKTFIVDEIWTWGVRCYWENQEQGIAYYAASWHEIEDRERQPESATEPAGGNKK